MSYPKDCLYTKDHEWIKLQGDTAVVGLSAFAIEQLGDVVHIEMPKVGTKYKQGDIFGSIESTKTVSDLYMPAACTVTEINTELKANPEKMAEDPYQKYWIAKVVVDLSPKDLFDITAYEKYLQEIEAHH